MKFDQCPNCGSERQLAEEAVAESINKPSGAVAMALMTVPVVKALTVDVVIAVVDVCADCGTVYAKEIIKKPAQVQVKQVQPPNFGGDGGKQP